MVYISLMAESNFSMTIKIRTPLCVNKSKSALSSEGWKCFPIRSRTLGNIPNNCVTVLYWSKQLTIDWHRTSKSLLILAFFLKPEATKIDSSEVATKIRSLRIKNKSLNNYSFHKRKQSKSLQMLWHSKSYCLSILTSVKSISNIVMSLPVEPLPTLTDVVIVVTLSTSISSFSSLSR